MEKKVISYNIEIRNEELFKNIAALTKATRTCNRLILLGYTAIGLSILAAAIVEPKKLNHGGLGEE